MINITNKTDCSGCGACMAACPSKAICLKADDEGFLYPAIETEKCINCGKCDKICPISNAVKKQNKSDNVISYAAKTKNEEIRQNSSSGGIFTEIAAYILEGGGVVFGAAFDDDFKVVHIGVDKIADLEKLRGSKYVQSEIGDSYIRAKEYLDVGRPVLFTGTPCQISGLYNFLNRDYDNLYTQDIICHGVPSPMVWQKYIEYRETVAAAKLRRTFFRHKKYGWKMYSVQFEFTNCTEYMQIIQNDLYMRSFLQNLSLRPSCYNCAFKTKTKSSDLTLADFWGIEKICPEIDDDKGTSLVLVNSDKGKRLFEKIKINLECCETDFEESIKYNSAMTTSVPYNQNRENFIRSVSKKGFYSGRKYIKTSFVREIKKIIKSILKK